MPEPLAGCDVAWFPLDSPDPGENLVPTSQAMKKPWRQISIRMALSSVVAPLIIQAAFPSSAQAQGPAPGKELTRESRADKVAKEAHQPHEKDSVIKPVAVVTTIPPLPGNWKSAEVILELIIDIEGRVSEASVVSGQDPFAAAALSATKNWEFKPARRNDEPVPSKIHFMVTFTPVEKAPSLDAPDDEKQEVSAAPESQGSGQALEEVVVYGKIEDPGSISFSRAEVRNLPGAFDDPLRAIEVMPGVTPIASGLPLFFVRGAPPGNVGYFIDGIRVPLLYHAFLGPSVIHPAFIDQVRLSSGPIPAKFGRYAGAAVEVELAEPLRDFRAEASVRLIDAGAFVEAPINQGKGYALLGGRYSYTALLATLFSPGTRLDYWDYQGLVGYSLGRKDEVSLMALGAYDYFGSDGEVVGGTEYHRIDLRWDHNFSRDTGMRLAATWGRDRTRSDSGYLSDDLWGFRFSFQHRAEDFVFRSGADLWLDNYNMDVDPAIAEPEIYTELFPPRTDGSGGVWADVVLFPRSKIQIIPGVRADIYSSLDAVRASVDPRISAEYHLTPRLRAIHSLGTAHQSPNFVPNVPGAQVAGLNNGLQQSLQAATKYEADLPWDVTGSVTFFINGTKQLTDPIGLGQSLAIDEQSGNKRAQGRAYGIEFFFKRALTRRWGALISYTLSKTLRSSESITTVPGYERPHVFNGALSYDFGYNIRASVKLALASGIPAQRLAPSFDGFIYDTNNRSDPYVRVDAKLSKRWIISDSFEWGAHLEVLNATYSPNVSTRKCTVDEGCKNGGTGPITFPSLGVDASWK